MNLPQAKDFVAAIKALNAQGKPHEFKDATWAYAKRYFSKSKMTEYNEYRAKFVRAIALIIAKEGKNPLDHSTRKPCPSCMVRGSGSNDPASDIDLSVVGWGANRFVRDFNELFEASWPGGKTSAEVFDVNLYADCWVWPQAAFTNLNDDESYSVAKELKSSVMLKEALSRKVNMMKGEGDKVNKRPLCFVLRQMNDDLVWSVVVLGGMTHGTRLACFLLMGWNKASRLAALLLFNLLLVS